MQRHHYPHSDFAKETYFKKSQFHDRLCTARNAGYPILTNFIRMLCNTLQARRERGRQYVTDTVSRFIARLIIHIPDGKFHQIRYYGFYSNRTRSRPRHRKMSSEMECSEVRRFLRWENRLVSVYGYTPLLCECGARMRINYRLSYFPGMGFEEGKRKDSG